MNHRHNTSENARKMELILQILDIARELTDAGYGWIPFAGVEGNGKTEEVESIREGKGSRD